MSAQAKLKILPAVTITGTASRITENSIKCTLVEFHTATANSGSAYIGSSDINSTDGIPLVANTTKSYTPSEIASTTKGDWFDLKDFYVVGTANDVLRVQYIEVGG